MKRPDQDPKKLTEKEELACRKFIISLDATEAFIEAGYSAKYANKNAFTFFRKEHIKKRINELKAERNNRLEIKADDVLRDVDKIQQSCMQEVELNDRYGLPLGITKMVDYANALKACELKGKHLGMFDKKESGINLNINTTPFEINIVE